MKLPDFTDFEPFNELRRKMKADLIITSEFKQDINRLSLAELEVMQNEGLEIDINQVYELEDGTLAYKDRRVLIYIRDINSYGQEFNLPRFHLAYCRTYKDMKQRGRSERYFASIRTDGYFEIIKIGNYRNQNETCKLSVCKNCLSHIHYKQYPRNKDIIFSQFLLKEYFENYPTDFLSKPKYNSDTAPLNQYSIDFKDISRQKRVLSNWTCYKCYVILEEKHLQKYLHTHHKNGLKFDNNPENLEILCYKCHAKQPSHGHMKNDTYYEFLEIYHKLKKQSI